MAVQLNNINGTLLPPTITGPIFDQTLETSAVMSLARKVPLAMTSATAIPVSMDVPTAGWVAEGGMKPVAAGGVGVKMMTGKKVAVIVPVSKEVASSNAAGLYEQLRNDLPTALSRAFDYAAIHGKDLASGGAGPFGDNYLRKNAGSTELGAAAASAGGMWKDLWTGVKSVTDVGYDFSGFAADPRLRPTVATSVDSNGRPFFVDNMGNVNGRDNAGTLLGYPTFFNRGVSGTYRRQSGKVWDITLVGTPTGGTWSVSIGGTVISGLAYNISAANLQVALRAAALPGASTIAVSGTAPYSTTFPIGVPKPIVDQTSLTGGTAAASSATIARHTSPDTTVRAVGGDFSQCAYGVGMDITIDISTQASYSPDGGTTWVSLWQNNLVGILAEAYFGFVVADNEGAFVQYLDAS